MYPIIVQIEQICVPGRGIKERFFEWVAEMSQAQFDQLCCEITGMQTFFEKYSGCYVTDSLKAARQAGHNLVRTEFVLSLNDTHFNKKYFYRWLESTSVDALQKACYDLEDAYDQVVESLNTFVIPVSLAKSHFGADSWKIQKMGLHNLQAIARTVEEWAVPVRVPQLV